MSVASISVGISDLSFKNVVSEYSRITVGNFCIPSEIRSNTYINTNDGSNSGLIDQISTNLTLSVMQGGNVVIGDTNKIVFKNDNSIQRTAYSGISTLNDCALLSRSVNRAIAATTISLNDMISPVETILTANIIYAAPVRLVKGQIITAIGTYSRRLNITQGGTMYLYAALYNSNTPPQLVSTTGGIEPDSTSSFKPLEISAYTVPSTGIYYACLRVLSATSGGPGNVQVLTCGSSTTINYGNTTVSNGVLNKFSNQSGNSLTSFPPTFANITFSNYNFLPFIALLQ